MKILNLKRGQGKTTFLIIQSHLTGYPILTYNEGAKDDIVYKAEKMNLIIPKPLSVSVSDLFAMQGMTYHFDKILVDEMPLVLDCLLSRMIHSNIATATMTLED